MNDNINLGEVKIFQMMQNTTEQAGIHYVKDFGYREFLNDGSSFGLCSNQFWKSEKKSSHYKTIFKDFYCNELLTLKRNGYRYSVRVQGQCFNKFLETISNHGLGNVLAMYVFSDSKIYGYYFLIDGSDYNSVTRFCNDIHVFEKIVSNIEKSICQVIELFAIYKLAEQLLPPYAVKELFATTISIDKKSPNLFKSGIFTQKQTQVLILLANGCTKYKAIAKHMNIRPRTTEWYIRTLKNKTNLSTKTELINFAKCVAI